MDHFVIAVISAEKEWETWSNNPFSESMPKIEMEVEKSSSIHFSFLIQINNLFLHKNLKFKKRK